MKQLLRMPVKHQYTLVQALYWVTSCAMCGYAAVYLLYRGLSNTLVGVVVGGAAFISLIVQPLTAQLTESIPFLTVKRMVQLIIVVMAAAFMVLTLVPLSSVGVMIVYMVMYMFNLCMQPLLSAMGMEFINRGYYLNFGLSRGMGSISYAVCAAILGFVLSGTNPDVLGYIYVVCAAFLMVAVSIMKDLGKEEKTVKSHIIQDTDEGMLQIILKNHVFLSLLIGFCLTNASSMGIITYTVNIIKSLGGNDATLGMANFVVAASEMPVMLLFGFMMRKSNCIKLLKVSALFFVLRPFILLLAGNLPVAFVGLMLQGMSFGLFTPAAVYYVNSALAPEKRVKGQAVFSMVTSGVSTCIGNVLGGWLQDSFGLKQMLLVSVIIAFVGFVIILRLPNDEEQMSLGQRIVRLLRRRKSAV
jgi:PPP family 3-phenylpropionic acid transporter